MVGGSPTVANRMLDSLRSAMTTKAALLLLLVLSRAAALVGCV